MTILLKKDDAVRLAIGPSRRENARVKAWMEMGCINFAFSGNIALRPGTKVQVEIPNSEPRAFYYMQAIELPGKEKTELCLSRNTNSQFDQRRRSWRVPYSAKTAIRKRGEEAFFSAEFTNISMDAAYLLTECKFDINTEVVLRLALPEYPEHSVIAHVMRVSDMALDRDAKGKERWGLLVRFHEIPALVSRHLTYFMWQQIRKTHLRQLQVVFAGNSKRPAKNAGKIVANVEKEPKPLD